MWSVNLSSWNRPGSLTRTVKPLAQTWDHLGKTWPHSGQLQDFLRILRQNVAEERHRFTFPVNVRTLSQN
ncbi:hypothetical protein THIX_70157 [Thiomonas sp. X19]|nr:hypothetical protein THIX_70157 [Thiomonas sp. X19]